MGDQRFEQGVFRAEAAGAAPADRPQPQQPHPAVGDAEALGDVVHLGVQLEPAADRARLRARTLVNQRLHLGDRFELGVHCGCEAKRQTQVACRVGVDGDDVLAALGVYVGKQGGQRGFADAPLPGDSDFRHCSVSLRNENLPPLYNHCQRYATYGKAKPARQRRGAVATTADRAPSVPGCIRSARLPGRAQRPGEAAAFPGRSGGGPEYRPGCRALRVYTFLIYTLDTCLQMSHCA